MYRRLPILPKASQDVYNPKPKNSPTLVSKRKHLGGCLIWKPIYENLGQNMVVKELWMKFNCSLSTQGRKRKHVGQVFSHLPAWTKTKNLPIFSEMHFWCIALFIQPFQKCSLDQPSSLGCFETESTLFCDTCFLMGYPWNSPRLPRKKMGKQNKKYPPVN